jgi:hypothetical protein
MFPPGQSPAEVDINIPESVRKRGATRAEMYEVDEAAPVGLGGNAGGDDGARLEGDHDDHAQEEQDVQEKLVGHAVVDEERHQHAEDQSCDFALSGEWLFKREDAVHYGADGEMHGELVR